MGTRIKVLIADDHPLLRAGVAALLAKEGDIQIVAEVDNGRDAIQKAKDLIPDVVLMDITMPDIDGFDATSRIVRGGGKTKVLVLTQHEHEEYVKRIMHAGASGYILKSAVADELIKGIRAVEGGDQFFTPEVSRIMVKSYVKQATGKGSQQSSVVLTAREREILQRIAEGKTNQMIANQLHISVRTVEFHRANISAKIGAHDTASLVKFAIQKKIIRLEP